MAHNSKPHKRNHNTQKPRAAKPLSGELAARQAALKCLLSISEQHVPLDVALDTLRATLSSSNNSHGFAEHLVRSTLKHAWMIAPFTAQFLTKPWDGLPSNARWLFCMAAVQLHLMDVPDYAAVNTTVELAKSNGLMRLSGMMNAVMKKMAAAPLRAQDYDILEAVPEWLCFRLTQDYGADTARTMLLASMADVDTFDITVPDDARRSELCDVWNARALSGHTLRIAAGRPVAQLEGFDDGDWWVQDVASALPLYAIAPHLHGKRVLDVCAAPGGKTMQALSYGATVDALDRSKGRLKRLRENLTRIGKGAGVICADMLDYEVNEPYDVVILDAPCSATGTLRRHPDLLIARDNEDVVGVVDLQRRMLEQAIHWVVPGGYVLYAVCSLLKAEGEEQIEALCDAHAHVRIVALENIDASLRNSRGQYRAMPNMMADQGGMDGFFACLLRVS